MSTVVTKRRRFPYSYIDGEYVREKRVEETINEEIDFYHELDGETISSVEVETSGPTISSETVANGIGTNTKITFTVDSVGAATFKATTSGGRVLERRLRWKGTNNDLDSYR